MDCLQVIFIWGNLSGSTIYSPVLVTTAHDSWGQTQLLPCGPCVHLVLLQLQSCGKFYLVIHHLYECKGFILFYLFNYHPLYKKGSSSYSKIWKKRKELHSFSEKYGNTWDAEYGTYIYVEVVKRKGCWVIFNKTEGITLVQKHSM